jgi:RHS repeat-associated protein
VPTEVDVDFATALSSITCVTFTCIWRRRARSQYTLYNVAGEVSTKSVQYFVAAYTGAAGSAAYSLPDSTQLATTTTYDGLGRTLRVTDPLSNVTQTAYSVVCSAPGTSSDTGCYEQTLGTDANNHRHGALVDGFGRPIYAQRYSGTSPSTYALYSTVKNTYDYTGHLTQVLHPDGTHTTTSTYDTAGRLLTLSDPDRSVASSSYDANGNLTQQIDARCGTALPQTPCSAGTIYTGYDGLNRPIWRNTTNSPTGAYVTYSYDSTAGGNNGVGRLTGEQFNGGPGSGNLGAGSYSYTYDALGQQSGWSVTLGGSTYPFSYTYNDASMPTSLTYSDGEQLSYGYDSASGWLTSLITTPSGGSTTNLLTAIAYSGAGGAAGKPTGANVVNSTYTYSASYDADLRLTALSLTQGATTKFSATRTYDAVGNVASVNTTLAAGTDNQAFCYDEQNRLTWASSASGSIPCGGTLTAGTLTAAQYGATTASFDTLDRQTTENSTSYTYGDSAHLHAVTSLSAGYSAKYDPAGNLTCRAPTSGTTCTSTPQTGGVLTFDNEGRLTAWQNQPSNPTSTEAMAYDGEGQRVALQVNGGTPTYYLGSLEEIVGSTLTKYLGAPGLPTALRVGTGGALSYLASDGLGSTSEALDGSGTVTFQQLYLPYGGIRYTSGAAPTAKAFTGQRWDSTDGLYYYGARYYDPSAHQFTSADTVADGLNRYGYVHANPETFTDPTGHRIALDPGGGGGGTSPPTSSGGTAAIRHSGTQADQCISKAKCVVFIDGVDIKLPKPGSYQDIPPRHDHGQWNQWTNYLDRHFNWGGAFYVASDGPAGMWWLHTILSKLATLAFSGSVTVVGHSNGAAAIFWYFAVRQWGGFAGDRSIQRFVAFNAPLGILGFWWGRVTASVWSLWSPSVTQWSANLYIWRHHIHGLYAWEGLDLFSGWVSCACQERVYWNAWPWDAHTKLLFDPRSAPGLLAAL